MKEAQELKALGADDFTDWKFESAAEKRSVLRDWVRFLKSDFAEGRFTEKLYHHLSQHCSFIAHYNRSGFYSVYFDRPDGATRKFIAQFDGRTGCISVEYGWSGWVGRPGEYQDINEAMIRAMVPHADRLYKLVGDQERERDLATIRRLEAKHGIRHGTG